MGFGIALLILFTLSVDSTEQEDNNIPPESVSAEEPAQNCFVEFSNHYRDENCLKKESLLVWGFLLTGVGLVTMYRNKPNSPKQSERFSGIKNLFFNRPEKKK